MIRILPVAIVLFTVALLHNRSAIAQPSRLLSAPKDKFSKAFLQVYKDAPKEFMAVKGKKVKTGEANMYGCKKVLPGSNSGNVITGDSTYCIFRFGSYDALADAEAAMLELSSKITYALLQRSIVKYIDSSQEQLVKRTAIAEIKNDGFEGYNILVDVVKKEEADNKFGVQLVIKGGKGTVYRFVHKEPFRSPLFVQTFKKMFTQFDESDSYYCNELLPGFQCALIDSAGRKQLMMEKQVADFPDARVEFEALTTNLRSMLTDSFLYYGPPTNGNVLREIVFIHAAEQAKNDRKSIATYLVKDDTGGYAVRVMMYHP